MTLSTLLCLALLHFLWQGAAIAAAAWLLAAVARRFSAQAQYLVLLAGLVALPVAFAVTLGVLASDGVSAKPAVTVIDMPESSDEPRPLYLLSDAPGSLPIAQPLWQRYAPLFAVAYLLTIATLSLRLLCGLCGARRLVRESAAVTDERLLTFLADQCQLLGLRTAPLVAYCRDVAVPTVIGVLRPTILLPLSATTGLTGEEIETILTHELVHIRRCDPIFVLLQRLLEVLFFFHPAVWLLSRRISDVREHCCDDRVISLGIEPQVYVESLLRAAELSLFGPSVKPSSSLAIALSAVDQPSRLRERILRLMDRPTPSPLKLRPLALTLSITALVTLLAAPLAMQSLAQTPAKEPATNGQAGNSDQGKSGVIDINVADDFAPVQLRRGLNIEWAKALGDFDQDGIVDLFVVSDTEESTARRFRDQPGGQFDVQVTGKTDGNVWGTDVYTDDSDLGTAAVHAGLVKPGEKAKLVLTVVKSPPRHIGSTRNGVTTNNFGVFGGSFMLHKPAAGIPVYEAEPKGIVVFDPDTGTRWQTARVQAELAAAQAAEARARDDAARLLAQRPSGSLVDATDADKVLLQAWVNAWQKVQDIQAAELAYIHRTKTGDCRSCHRVNAPQKVEDIQAAKLAYIHRTKTGDCRSCHHATAEHLPVSNATSYRGKFGRQFDVEIVGRTDGSVWGTDVYTDDSNIATAAVHSGAVKPNEQAIVTVTIVESPDEHVGSERNGVKSSRWDASPSSYIVTRRHTALRTPARPVSPETAMGFRGKLGRRFDIEVVGRSDGSLWGTDVYTCDSNIATAAVHCGLVKPGERAILTLTMVESPERHAGSTRNGVTSGDYGGFESSYILQRSNRESSAVEKGIRYLLDVQRAPDNATAPRAEAAIVGTAELLLQAQNAALIAEQRAASDRAAAAEQQAAAAQQAALAERKLAQSQYEQAIRAVRDMRILNKGANAVIMRGDFGTQLDVEITGRTTGHVWGTDVYTDDSDIPTAAVHAGLLKPGERGTVTITIVKSPEKYDGCMRNDVTSGAWGEHSSGFVLLRKKETPRNPTLIPPATPSSEVRQRVY
jgi:beta-lactamase regulating signal transducer with metallopeptidase domain